MSVARLLYFLQAGRCNGLFARWTNELEFELTGYQLRRCFPRIPIDNIFNRVAHILNFSISGDNVPKMIRCGRMSASGMQLHLNEPSLFPDLMIDPSRLPSPEK
jgi:hypothetical protein